MSKPWEILFLGSGSAFYTGASVGENWQSNVLIKAPSGRNLLLDCGGDIRFSLLDQGLSCRDVHELYVSHLHADHIGGMEWLAFCKFFGEHQRLPLHLSRLFVNDLWHNSLSGGLASLEGQVAELKTYFDVRPVPKNRHFEFEGTRFQLVQVVHIMNGYAVSPSFGLFFEVHGQKVFFTSDSQFTLKNLWPFYRSADIIFQDCETSAYRSGVHAHYSELLTLPPEIRSKMHLYHYNPGAKPDAQADGFVGFVDKGFSQRL